MKNKYSYLLFISACLITLMSNGQSLYNLIDINNVRAKLYSSNQLFWSDTANLTSGFEVPKGSGLSTIFAGKMWIGGKDHGGNLKLAAETYRQRGNDFFNGPLDTITATTDSNEMLKYNFVWKVNKSAIDSFIANYNLPDPGYHTPQSILTWPGNGDQSRNEARFLAPYVDVNSDGFYSSDDGDYPCIKGDQALFYIFNDAGGPHTETGGATISIEVRAIAYAFNKPSDTAVNNTIFINYQVINRSSDTLFNTYVGNWTDFDIGYLNDDYIGCDVSRSYYYGYNGEPNDPGFTGYGLHPPAQGVVFLKGPLADPADGFDNNHNGVIDEPNETFVMSNFMFYNNDFLLQGNPITAANHYNYMKSIWIDGTPLTYGGSGHGGAMPTLYAFPDTSDPTHWGTGLGVNNGPIPPANSWSEFSAGDLPGDRRGVGSWGPFTLLPGSVNCIDYAYVFAPDTTKDNIGNIVALQQAVEDVRAFYDAHPEIQGCNCGAANVAVNNLSASKPSFNIYPNPASNNLIVSYPSYKKADENKIIITNALGQILYQSSVQNRQSEIDISFFSAGVYFLQLTSEQGSAAKMFVKE